MQAIEVSEPSGPGATPERREPRCQLLPGFQEELRALLILAGPAVSKVASVGGWARRVGGPARVSPRVT